MWTAAQARLFTQYFCARCDTLTRRTLFYAGRAHSKQQLQMLFSLAQTSVIIKDT
jgi:hypothetical protein